MVASVSEIVERIDQRASEVWKAQNDPETLSKLILELSALNMALGTHLSAARSTKSQTKLSYEYAFHQAKMNYIGDGNSATSAESQAKLDTYEKQVELAKQSELVAMLTLKRNDTEQIINDAKARLNTIRSDMR